MGVTAALLLTACVNTTPPDVSAIGDPPQDFDPDVQVKAAMLRVLKDGMSAEYRRVGGPVPGRASPGWLEQGKPVDGWAYCYAINAKNSFGAYTGFKPYYFVFNSYGQLIGAADNPQLGSWNCF